MKNANRSIGLVVCCVILICAAAALGQDWPQWRGPARDGKVTGFTAPKTWPKELKQAWKVEVGSGDSTPALVGDKLYVFARQDKEEVILCLNATNGEEVWKDKYAAQAVMGPARRHPGPRSSPAVTDGKVFTLGVWGMLSCLDAAKGEVLWRKDPFKNVTPQFYTAMSPIIVDGMAIAQLGGEKKGAIMAFDLATGEEKWKLDNQGSAYASPALLTVAGTKQIATLTSGTVVGVGVADGKLLWEVPFVRRGRAYNAATPIVDGQTVIFTGAGRGTQAVKVEKTGDGFAAKEVWRNKALAVQFNTPVLKNGLLFGLSERGNLFCINAKTGKTAWTDRAGHGRGFAAIVDAGSVILALPNHSQLIAFEPDGKKYTELARIKVADKPTYAHPVVAGKRIFVRDENSVAMLTLE
jgi:outer membrane protein assembly factor BamB